MKRATIVIRSYNAEDTIERAVKSAAEQDFPPEEYEILAIDDGSKDSTPQMLAALQKEIPQLRLILQGNQGPIKALNRALKEAKGEYVTLCDADDTIEPAFLRETVSLLDARPEIDFVYSDYYEHEDGEIRVVSVKDNLFATIAAAILFRKEKLAEAGFYKEGIPWPEYDLLLRTWGLWKGKYLAKPLYHYYRYPQSITRSSQDWTGKKLEELKKIHPAHIDLIDKIRRY